MVCWHMSWHPINQWKCSVQRRHSLNRWGFFADTLSWSFLLFYFYFNLKLVKIHFNQCLKGLDWTILWVWFAHTSRIGHNACIPAFILQIAMVVRERTVWLHALPSGATNSIEKPCWQAGRSNKASFPQSSSTQQRRRRMTPLRMRRARARMHVNLWCR